MQVFFTKDDQKVNSFKETISDARISRYLRESGGDIHLAMSLYHWNSLLSQSMYLPLQIWEISLRNRLNQFLCWKYNKNWPYDERANRALAGNARRRLNETKERFDPDRRTERVSTNAIVADLSAGFWVSLLTSSHEQPFVWRYNLTRVFPNLENLDRQAVSTMCDQMLVLRNRVAHHEPILHMDLPQRRADLTTLIGAACAASSAYCESACTFEAIWNSKPTLRPANDQSVEANSKGTLSTDGP